MGKLELHFIGIAKTLFEVAHLTPSPRQKNSLKIITMKTLLRMFIGQVFIEEQRIDAATLDRPIDRSIGCIFYTKLTRAFKYGRKNLIAELLEGLDAVLDRSTNKSLSCRGRKEQDKTSNNIYTYICNNWCSNLRSLESPFPFPPL